MLILLGVLLFFSIKRFNNSPLKVISVDLLKTTPSVYFIDEKDIIDSVHKHNPKSKLGDIDIPDLERKIKSLPSIDSANIYLNLNGDLHLDIKQRVPAFRLQYGKKDFYVDTKGIAFPTSKNYSLNCMLVTGDINPKEYQKLIELVKKINTDNFCKKFFIGIEKRNNNYYLLTSSVNYKVEFGDLDNIDFKINGFKTFVEKYLINQPADKYTQISIKYNNQIVATLNHKLPANDSILNAGRQELQKIINNGNIKTN